MPILLLPISYRAVFGAASAEVTASGVALNVWECFGKEGILESGYELARKSHAAQYKRFVFAV
jgi:hypothetical protein